MAKGQLYRKFPSDLKYGYRMLVKKPAFTLLAILTLALGIGANVATYSIVHGVLFRPLPFQQPDQLVRVYDDLRGSNSQDVGMSVPELVDFQQRAGIFQEITGAFPADVDLTGGDHPERIELQVTSANYFTMLEARPQLGEVYSKRGEAPGFSGEAVISDGLWHREFGGDPQVIGKQTRLDNDLYTIIGVDAPRLPSPRPDSRLGRRCLGLLRFRRPSDAKSNPPQCTHASRRVRPPETRPDHRPSPITTRRIHNAST